MVRRSLLLVLLSGFAFADTGFKDLIQFTETDNSPKCMAGQVKVGSGQLTCSGNVATLTITGGGGGGSSSLAVTAGVARSSPTSDLMFNPNQFSGSVSGSSITISAIVSSVTLQGQNVIKLTSELQSGATFYLSTGTVNTFYMTSGIARSDFSVQAGGSSYLYNGANNSGSTLRNPGAGGEQMLQMTAANGASINQSPVNGVDLTLASQRVTGLTASQLVKTDSSKNLVSGSLTTSDIPGGATSYIHLTSALQSGATFYVSSGTVAGKFTARGLDSLYFSNSNNDQELSYHSTTLPSGGGFGPQVVYTDIFTKQVNDLGSVGGTRFSASTQTYAQFVASGDGAYISVSAPTSAVPGGNVVLSLSTGKTVSLGDSALTVSHALTVNGQSVCLEDGTDCPAAGAADNLGSGTGSYGVATTTGGFTGAGGVSVTYGIAVGSMTASSATIAGQFTAGTYQGGALATCGDSTHALSWSAGSFGCQEITVPAGTGDNLGSGVGSYGIATTTGGFTGADGVSVTYGLTVGSVTANDLTASQFIATNVNKKLTSTLNGSSLTDLTGANIASSIPSSVLPSTVAYLSSTNTWTGGNVYQGYSTFVGSAAALGRLSIPNGTGPTVSAVGDIALDTTAGQLVTFDGVSEQVIGTSTRAISVTISSGTGWSGKAKPFKFPVLGAVTITQITAETLPSGSTVQYQLDERAFGSIGSAGTSVYSVAFSSGNATGVTETGFANAGIASQASLVLTTPSGATAAAGSPTVLNVTIYYRVDRQ